MTTFYEALVWVLVAAGFGGLGTTCFMLFTGKWRELEPEPEYTLNPVPELEDAPQFVREQVEERIRAGAPEPRFQVLSITARKVPLLHCKVEAQFDEGRARLFWEGFGTEHVTPPIAKEEVSLEVGHSSYIILWGVSKQNDKQALYFPTVNRPQVAHPVGLNLPPIKLTLFLTAGKFNDKPRHYLVHRKSFENIRAEDESR